MTEPRYCEECGRILRPKGRERPETLAKKTICGMKCALTRYERTRITEILVEGKPLPSLGMPRPDAPLGDAP